MSLTVTLEIFSSVAFVFVALAVQYAPEVAQGAASKVTV